MHKGGCGGLKVNDLIREEAKDSRSSASKTLKALQILGLVNNINLLQPKIIEDGI